MIIKHILASTLIALSCSTFAQDYTVISESEEGNQLVLDLDSVVIKKNDSDKTVYVGGMFLYPIENTLTVPFVITLPTKDCRNGMGTLYHLEQKRSEWKLIDTYVWSTKGNKIYDHSAIALCAIYQQKAKGISV